MKNNKYYKLLAMILIGILIFSLTACGGDSAETVETTETTEVTDEKVADVVEESTEQVAETSYDTEWAIYWYLCGSDLESEGGAATMDMLELMETKLPPNVKFIIQTGGASSWQNDFVNPDYLERYLYDSNGLQLIEQQPLASMGSEQTLSEFLSFAKTNYPANKTAVIFWNHGGGSVNGSEFDENFNSDSLTLDEMYSAFSSNYELSVENPPFELIGFDTCLMATVDVAATFTDIGK